jgi:hypothetical protein
MKRRSHGLCAAHLQQSSVCTMQNQFETSFNHGWEYTILEELVIYALHQNLCNCQQVLLAVKCLDLFAMRGQLAG